MRPYVKCSCYVDAEFTKCNVVPLVVLSLFLSFFLPSPSAQLDQGLFLLLLEIVSSFMLLGVGVITGQFGSDLASTRHPY